MSTSPDTPDPTAWWSALSPEARKVWFQIITGWSIENTIKAAFARATGEPPPKAADIAFQSLVKSIDVWCENHMDQWEKFKLPTEFGHTFVTISTQDQYPDSFDLVDHNGHVIQQAGVSQIHETTPVEARQPEGNIGMAISEQKQEDAPVSKSTADWNNIWTSIQELGAAISPLTEQAYPPGWAVSLHYILDIAIEEVEDMCSAGEPVMKPVEPIAALHPKDETEVAEGENG